MTKIVLEITVVLLLIVANGVFAMAEIAIVSSRRVRLEHLAQEGDSSAKIALELVDDPNRFLSTIQTGITLIGIFAGAFGGRTLAQPLGEQISRITILSPYSQSLALIIIVASITYLTLVIGELSPKRIALANPEGIAIRVARPMTFWSRLATPIVKLLSLSTRLVVRLLGISTHDEPPITQEELKMLLHEGTESGIFKEDEEVIINRVLNVADQRIGALMIPRTKVVALDLTDPIEVIQRQIASSKHGFFPVYEERKEQIVGIISIKDLLARTITGYDDKMLKLCLHPPLFIPESIPVLNVINLLKQESEEIAIIINEHGGMEGIVTLNDLLEALVGDIPLLTDQLPEPTAIQRVDGSWLVDGLLPIMELEKILTMNIMPEDEKGIYRTVGGFMMKRIGQIPDETDVVTWNNLRFEVVDIDQYRVDKVLVTKLD